MWRSKLNTNSNPSEIILKDVAEVWESRNHGELKHFINFFTLYYYFIFIRCIYYYGWQLPREI